MVFLWLTPSADLSFELSARYPLFVLINKWTDDRESIMHVAIRMIVGAVFFAVALLLSSWLLKGQRAGDWVDAALYIGLAGVLLSQVYFALPGSQNSRT